MKQYHKEELIERLNNVDRTVNILALNNRGKTDYADLCGEVSRLIEILQELVCEVPLDD